MLYQLGHGQNIKIHSRQRGGPDAGPAETGSVPITEVCSISRDHGESSTGYYPLPNPDPQPSPGLAPREVFRFYCKDAPMMATSPDIAAKILAVADAMAEATLDEADAAGESTIPPVFTYLGQFIDHDITANTDREEADPAQSGFNIDRPDIAPQPRDEVEKQKLNLRNGRLNLDSVYGDGPGQSPEAERMEAALRDPADPAKMRLGKVSKVTNGQPFFIRPDLPVDDFADIPRVGAALDDGSLTLAEVETLLGAGDEARLRQRALIGDGRNDENLIVAQLHLSFLRLHNAIVDKLRADGMTEADALFLEARRNVTWIYQWMVVHVFLKTICDPAVVDQVLADEAPVYTAFHEAHKAEVPEGTMPMPLEFSVAAFRYGHSMVRGDYDYNRSFGRAPDGSGDGRASFDLLFGFTGGGAMNDTGSPTLPDNWIIEWDRFIGPATLSERVARKIDARLALPLKAMRNNPPGLSGIMGHLAARNLRRGHVFNLPDAQGMIAHLASLGVSIPQLTPEQLASGATGQAVTAAGFDRSTPLWFYVLKEAEAMADGNHLGPLGSRLVAETLVGLLATDTSSYIRQGAFDSWTPAQAVQPLGEPLDSLAAMLRAGGLLAVTAAASATAPQTMPA